MAKKRGGYYAVERGRHPGVYTTWDGDQGAKAQVNGFSGAKYEKFETRAEADAFVMLHRAEGGEQDDSGALGSGSSEDEAFSNGHHEDEEDAGVLSTHAASESKRSSSSTAEAAAQTDVEDLTKSMGTMRVGPDPLIVFCKGSAKGNGELGCKAGYACVFPNSPDWDVAKKLTKWPLTNNRADYFAALRAMKRANKEDPSQSRELIIYTNLEILVRTMTEWIAKWQRNHWIKANKEPVENQDLLIQMLDARGSRSIKWKHVHTDRMKAPTPELADLSELAGRRARDAMESERP